MRATMRLRIVAAACALVVGLSAGAAAKILYVDDGTKEGGTGSTWANACNYLQTALIAATAGDEIRVAQGLYRPDHGLPPVMVRARSGPDMLHTWVGGPAAVFELKSGVALLGGFAGPGAVDPNARDPQKYPTILSGDLRGNDEDLLDLRGPQDPSWGPQYRLSEYLRTDNSFYVVDCISTDATAVLDGFVIESGVQAGFYNIGGSPRLVNCIFQKGYGTALRCEGGQPTLVNCIFQENNGERGTALNVTNARVALTNCRFVGSVGNWAYDGGAIYATGSDLSLTDCRFVDNCAGDGGAIYVTTSDLSLTGCCFVGNWAVEGGGGAIYATTSDLSLTGCTFEMNAGLSGGAFYQAAGTLTLVDSTFEGNAAARKGGAVSFAGEKASMTRCVFKKNWALEAGGALENRGSPLILDQCTFTNNRADTGGGLCASRLTASPTVPGLALTRCLFTGNYASTMGGALYGERMELTIRNGTFTGNRAEEGATVGWNDIGAGEIACSLTLENCVVWDGGQSILLSSAASAVPGRTLKMAATTQNVTVRYSDVQGGWVGEGNIDIDPGFAAPGYWAEADNPALPAVPSSFNPLWVDGDYHLKSPAGRWDPDNQNWTIDEVTSPCIDAGDPNSPVGDEPAPNGGRINMGAYGGTVEASKSPRETDGQVNP